MIRCGATRAAPFSAEHPPRPTLEVIVDDQRSHLQKIRFRDGAGKTKENIALLSTLDCIVKPAAVSMKADKVTRLQVGKYALGRHALGCYAVSATPALATKALCPPLRCDRNRRPYDDASLLCEWSRRRRVVLVVGLGALTLADSLPFDGRLRHDRRRDRPAEGTHPQPPLRDALSRAHARSLDSPNAGAVHHMDRAGG